MKENKTKITEGYCAPHCWTVDIESEGVVCSSFETPIDYDDEYAW